MGGTKKDQNYNRRTAMVRSRSTAGAKITVPGIVIVMAMLVIWWFNGGAQETSSFIGSDFKVGSDSNVILDSDVTSDSNFTSDSDVISGRNLEGPFSVERVVDGDTIVINYNGNNEKVRFIGVNTPESVKPDSPIEPYAKQASAFTKKNLQGKSVMIEFDVGRTDRYGRLLAYVYLDGIMFNKVLLEQGYAQLMTIQPNVKYVDEFKTLQETARKNKKGLWR